MLHDFVCWYVKCVEKVPFRLTFINLAILAVISSFSSNKNHIAIIAFYAAVINFINTSGDDVRVVVVAFNNGINSVNIYSIKPLQVCFFWFRFYQQQIRLIIPSVTLS